MYFLSLELTDMNTFLAGVGVLTAVVVKCFVFWDIIRCSLLKVNQRFDGTYHHLHIQRESQARNQREAEPGVPLKRLLTFSGLRGVISQKVEFFLTILAFLHPS
jgi:hypothetical protein